MSHVRKKPRDSRTYFYDGKPVKQDPYLLDGYARSRTTTRCCF
jgi:hypothetical protein